MITIQQGVNNWVDSKPYLAENMQDGLINLSSLARQMQPDIEKALSKPVKTGAIVMALRRYHQGNLATIRIKAGRLLQKIENIIVRSGISVFTYANTPELNDKLGLLTNDLVKQKELFFTFSYGIFETTIIANSRAETQVLENLRGEKLIASQNELSCITLYLPGENTAIAGYYYSILRLIAWEGINLEEVLSTTNEFSLIIHDRDVDRAFSVLKSK